MNPASASASAITADADTAALWLTLRLAFTTTLLLLAGTLPLAAWASFGSRHLRALLQSASMLPLLLPPTVLGYYLLVLLGPRTAPGRALAALTGGTVAFSFAGLLIGSLLYSLPFAIQPLLAGFAAIPRSLLEAASLLGASRLQTLCRVVLPLAWPSLLTAAVLSFAHTVGEFGIVLMLGGDIPGRTRTLSIAIFDQVQDFQFAAANRTALLLVGISFAALLTLYLLDARRARPFG